MTIGMKLKAVMDREGISGYRLWRLTNIQQSYISRLLSGKLTPNSTTLEKILSAIGYEIEFVKSKKGRG